MLCTSVQVSLAYLLHCFILWLQDSLIHLPGIPDGMSEWELGINRQLEGLQLLLHILQIFFLLHLATLTLTKPLFRWMSLFSFIHILSFMVEALAHPQHEGDMLLHQSVLGRPRTLVWCWLVSCKYHLPDHISVLIFRHNPVSHRYKNILSRDSPNYQWPVRLF